MCGSAAPYRQLRVTKRLQEEENEYSSGTVFSLLSKVWSDGDLQLMDVVVFDVDVEAVLLQQAVYTQLQFADVVFNLVVVNPW